MYTTKTILISKTQSYSEGENIQIRRHGPKILSQQQSIAMPLPKKGSIREQISLAMTNHFSSHCTLCLTLLYQGRLAILSPRN